MTSDEYFQHLSDINDAVKFDLVYIDGLHHADQVLKDIENSAKFLSKNGVIVCHDILPVCEVHARRLEDGEKPHGTWNGDCWKAFAKFCSHADATYFTLDFDYGIGVIDFSKRRTRSAYDIPDINSLSWSDYLSNRKKLAEHSSKEICIQLFSSSIC